MEKFKAAPETYSAILMDIHMPEVDSYEAMRQIRTLETTLAKNIPIIAIIANVFKEDFAHSFAAGMNGHIGKPIGIGTHFKIRIFVFRQKRRIPGGAKCIKTYMSFALGEPDAAEGKKTISR